MVKELVDCIKQISAARIVLGGPGFNYFGPEWFEYLDLDYGLRGEAEHSFQLFLEKLEAGGDIYSVPGCIYKVSRLFHKVPRQLIEDLDSTILPAYELFDLAQYQKHHVLPAIFSKRGVPPLGTRDNSQS